MTVMENIYICKMSHKVEGHVTTRGQKFTLPLLLMSFYE